MNPGCDLTGQQLELRALKIDPAHRAGEADLVRSRYFDYCQLHPVEATYRYAALYREQTRLWCEQTDDIETAADKRAFTPDDIFASRDMTAMWLARRSADAHGLPYEFVLAHAHKHFLERRFARFPRPNQLYSEEIELDLKDAWAKRMAEGVQWSRLELLKASRWRGLVVQEQHVAFVVKQVHARPRPQHRLLARLLHEDVLSTSRVQAEFGAPMLDAALNYLAVLVEPAAVSHC